MPDDNIAEQGGSAQPADQSNGGRFSSKPNRRTVLKSLAAGATATFGVGITHAETTETTGTDVVILKRDFTKPLQSGDFHSKVEKLQEEYRSITGTEKSSSHVIGIPDSQTGHVVGTALTIAPNGTVRKSTSIANRPRDVDKAHKNIDKEAQRLREENSAQASAITPQSPSGWQKLEDSKVTNYSKPVGDLVNNYSFYVSGGSYAYKERLDMFPGSNEYDTYNYRNGLAENKQTWSQHGAKTEIQDWAPHSPYSGNRSFSVGLTTQGPTFGYTYSQGAVSTVDLSSDRRNFARSRIDPNTSNAQHYTVGYRPGSTADFKSALHGTQLMKMESQALFKDNVAPNMVIDTSVSFAQSGYPGF